MRFPLTRRLLRGKIIPWIKLCAPPRVPPRVKIRGFSFCGCGGIGRLIGFRFQRASVQVRVLSSAPNKVDIFDTVGIETINLFLFAKKLAAQWFSHIGTLE